MRYSELVEICKDRENIYIFGHINPDGDCIGATIALKKLLENSGIKATIILKDVPTLYDFLDAKELSTETSPEKIDVAITLDCGDMTRVEDYKAAIEGADVLVNIDHHISNTYFGTYNFVDVKASSTCEIVYAMVDNQSLINKEIAEAIYTGIVYDTGIFKYSSTTKRTHTIAADLVCYGFDFTEIINKLFYYKSVKALKATSRAIDNIKVIENGLIAYSAITLKDIEELELEKDNTDGIVRILNEIENVECVFFIIQDSTGMYKVSLRSKGIVDVCEVAKQFGGGGHVKASGCSYDGEMENLIEGLIGLIKEQMITKTI